MNTRQYKNLKGLKKENLRDNMSTMELVLNMLAEATTTTLSRKQEPQTLDENIQVAMQGGGIAGDTRKAIETAAGESVITSQNAAQLNTLLTDMIDGVADTSGDNE